MKKTLLSLLGLFLCANVNAQLLDGTYVYLSGDMNFYVEVCDSGSVVCNFTIKDKESDNIIYQGYGKWINSETGGQYIIEKTLKGKNKEIQRNLIVIRNPKNKEPYSIIFNDTELNKL